MRFDRGAALRWWASLLLLMPVVALYACEYGRGDFTGFIQYDQPYYMANARKFFDGGFHLLYGNPFSPDPHTPAIYFQPHLFLLGLIWKITGGDPGTIYVIFGFVAGLICVRVALALYEQIAGLETKAQWAGVVLFIWGGGVLALAGLGYHFFHHSGLRTTLTDLFHFDPDEGWWFLNFGRNLVFPTEAYYHALALGTVVMALRNHFRAALWLAFILSLSHPFTGLQFLLILLAWSAIEIIVLKNKTIPVRFSVVLFILLIFHVFYYLFLLDLFWEHHVLFVQWSFPWREPFSSFLLSDVLVGVLAWLAMRNRKYASEFFADPANRLLLIWFAISFVLVHHDLLIKPRQPLHFSRGYVWIPLFLLGIRVLIKFIETSLISKNRALGLAAVAAIFLIGLSDNLAWFGLHGAMAVMPRWGNSELPQDGFCLSVEDRRLYHWLMSRKLPHDELLVAPDRDTRLIYLAMVYTDYRAWYSHFASTPFANQRHRELADFFRDGETPSGWAGRSVLVITRRSDRAIYGDRETTDVFQDGIYQVQELIIPN
jgi:hypothetical protein